MKASKNFQKRKRITIHNAKERRAGSLGYSEAMLIFYNKKMKRPLQWNILYSNKLKAPRPELVPPPDSEENEIAEENESNDDTTE